MRVTGEATGGGIVKYVAITIIAAVIFAALYAGNSAVRTWRASVAVRVVRLRDAQ